MCRINEVIINVFVGMSRPLGTIREDAVVQDAAIQNKREALQIFHSANSNQALGVGRPGEGE